MLYLYEFAKTSQYDGDGQFGGYNYKFLDMTVIKWLFFEEVYVH